jgi:hypothetical protein
MTHHHTKKSLAFVAINQAICFILVDNWELSTFYLVGGLEHEFYVSINWGFHHPN